MNYLFSFFFYFVISAATAQNLNSIDNGLASNYENQQTNLATECILDFEVIIEVKTDASLQVTEKITVNSQGENISRGIYRTLPSKRNLNQQTYPLVYKNIQIKKNGIAEDFHEEKTSDWLKIYVGSSAVYLDPGIYVYEIRYSVAKQIGFFENFDELYWNVTGTDWIFPIDQVKATVYLPSEATIIQNACYTGYFGSTETNCAVQQLNANTIVWQAKNLAKYEGLTVAVSFNKGVVIPPPPPSFLKLYGVSLFLLITFIAVGFYCYTLWKKYGVDPPKPVVIPQFNPPNNLSPAAVGYYISGKIVKKAITASLTNLAVKKYIVIEEIITPKLLGLWSSKEFKLKKTDQTKLTELPKEEAQLVTSLFRDAKSIKFNGSYNKKIEKALINYENSLHNWFDPIQKLEQNTRYLKKPMLICLLAVFIGFIATNILEENGSVKLLTYFITSIGLLLALFYATAKYKRKMAVGCLRIVLVLALISNLFFCFIIQLQFMINNTNSTYGYKSCFLFIICSAIGLLLMRYLMRKPTEEKVRLQAEIEGFKMYMSAAENEAIKFHNAPEFTPELFEKYLPYALIFGVDEIWGEKFNSLIQKSGIDYQPNWYEGRSFNSTTFSHTIASQLTSSFNSASTKPSSSSSGGSSSSGSSGGGSSGGGGGGGGGGGW